MLVNSLHSALKHAVEAFKGISVNVSPDILASAVRYEVMGRKMHVQMSIPPGFVCHDMRPAGDVRLDDQKKDRPRRAVVDVQHPVKLVSRNTLLARGYQMKRQRPLGQRNVAPLHDRPVRNGE